MGAGPRTGRGAGFCAGNEAPGYANAGPGRGPGSGLGCRGGGRGWRHVYYATGVPGWVRGGYGYVPPAEPAPKQELAALKAQASELGNQLDALNKRIAEIVRSGPKDA
jgi:hypothetical protein